MKLQAVLMVEISITEDEPGFFLATSPELPELMLGHNDFDTLIAELPAVIQGVAERRYNADVVVSPI